MKSLLFSLFLILNLSARAQSEIELQIQLLSADVIAEATLDQEAFIEWIKTVNEELKSSLQDAEGGRDVLVLFTLHHDEDATIAVGARPALDKKTLKSVTRKMQEYKGHKTKFTDYSFFIMAKIDGGCTEDIDFEPAIEGPLKMEMDEFNAMDLAGKKKNLQDWAKQEVLPMLAYFETNVDPKFEGVRAVGQLVENKKYLASDVVSITEENPDYWRATMEMSAGNQIIPFTKICMHIANGEFDRANRLLFILRPFYDESTLPLALHDELSSKLDALLAARNKQIQKGIAMHDEGNYKDAISHYQDLLKTFPNSAWINYEIYFSKIAENFTSEEADAEWDKAKEIIYNCDPLYTTMARAKSGKEGYQIMRRQDINSLFQQKEEMKNDFVKYADIALDLEDYGFAAQLYWLILTHFSPEDYGDRDILAHYLYCLDQLGDQESIKNFKGDYQKKFEEIEKERQSIMEENTFYKAFKKEE